MRILGIDPGYATIGFGLIVILSIRNIIRYLRDTGKADS